MDDAHEDNATRLERRREALRAWTDRVMEAIQAISMPETYLEGERALRCSATADRVLNQLYGKGSPAPLQPSIPSRPAAPRPAQPEPRPAPIQMPVSQPAPIPVSDFDGDEDDTDAVLNWLSATDEANPVPAADKPSPWSDEGWSRMEHLIALGERLAAEPLPRGPKTTHPPP